MDEYDYIWLWFASSSFLLIDMMLHGVKHSDGRYPSWISYLAIAPNIISGKFLFLSKKEEIYGS